MQLDATTPPPRGQLIKEQSQPVKKLERSI